MGEVLYTPWPIPVVLCLLKKMSPDIVHLASMGDQAAMLEPH